MISRRNFFVYLSALVAAAAALFVAYLGVNVVGAALADRAMTECTSDPRQIAPNVEVVWTWWEPGYVCVYTDTDGTVVLRRRP